MKRVLVIISLLAAFIFMVESCATVSRLTGSIARTERNDSVNDMAQADAKDIGTVQSGQVKSDQDIPVPGGITLPQAAALSTLQKELISIAKSKIGCRYAAASKGPNTFDCSGFMYYVFGQKGIRMEASSRTQYTQGEELLPGEPLMPCDLVFFSGRSISSTVGHVGMVLDYNARTGEFTFIHASCGNGVEIQSSKAQYYASRYIGARRILTDGR